MPASSSAPASVAWLNCGFRREEGKRRASTSVSTPASRRQSISSSEDRRPWPIVWITGLTRIESPL